ncbi:hypothetical protein [Streptobacillus canis]|uniref:hypothetical protein n=1 Tax=Streptobacillus canis TaxID=2678686 RepID=UPI0012E1877D|nr:hypothetical protein [Streptobacillus canis]
MKELEIRELIKKEVKTAVEYEMKDIQHLKIEDSKVLLKNYPSYKRRVEKIKFDIDYIGSPEYVPINFKEEGINVQGTKEYKSELEKKEEKIEKLKKELKDYTDVINKIERALNILKKNEYYMILELKYFNNLNLDVVLETMHISYGSYKRHHNKLIKEFKSLISL